MLPIKKNLETAKATWVRSVILLLIVLLAFWVILPQLGSLDDALRLARSGNWRWFIFGFAAIMAAPLVCAGIYRLLVIKPVPYRRIIVVQYAGMFVNRLLPAGIGGVGLFIDFFYKQKHSLAQASTIVAMNGVVGFIGHLLVVLVITVSVGLALPTLHLSWFTIAIIAAVVSLIAVAIGLLRRKHLSTKIVSFGRDMVKTFRSYRQRRAKVAAAVVGAALNTCLHGLALWFALQTFGITLEIGAIILIFSAGVALATATPTPGGIGGAEAAFTALLILYGVAAPEALAVAVLYRLMSYWLPLIPGLIAFWVAYAKRYV